MFGDGAAAWVGALCLSLTVTASAAAGVPTSAVASVSDGGPFSYTRGTELYSAGKGASVAPGDLIDTKPGALSIFDIRCGAAVCAVVALGPATRAYWLDKRDGATLSVLSGWVKVDTLAPGQNTNFKVLGTHLGAASSAGTYLVHATETADEVFHESGVMTLLTQKPDGTGVGRVSKPNEFASRAGARDVQSQPRPAAAFNDAMPAAFRDPLPNGLSMELRAKSEPKFIRDVTYDDVAAWLAAPRDWRKDFIGRFRPRLKDPVFFHALDVHLSAHPEWDHILHPPPPPEDGALARRSPASH